MPVIILTRFKGKQDYAPFVKDAAAILKKHGAMSLRAGRCVAGGDAGDVLIATAFADWAAYGRGMQGLVKDADWRKLQAEVSKVFDLQDRSLIDSEDF